MSISGIDIVIQLKQLKKTGKPCTQRWLLDELHTHGFPELTESTLSNILNERYTVGCSSDVLRTARHIVSSQMTEIV